MKKYKKEDTEVISTSIGYPYNTLQKGYPDKVSNLEINKTISKILENIRGNAGVENIVSKDMGWINLGLNELNNRENKKKYIIASWVSAISLLIASVSLIISSLALISSDKDYVIQNQQLDEMKNIQQILTEQIQKK